MSEQAENQFARVPDMMKQGKYGEASVLLEQIIPVFEAVGQWDRYAQCLNWQGECLTYIGKYNDAIACNQKALEISLEQWGEQSIQAADSYTNLGNCYRYIGEYQVSLSFHEKAFALCLHLLGENHLQTIAGYLSIGGCYILLGKYDQAIAYYQKNLANSPVILGEQDKLAADYYNNIGIVYMYKGLYEESIESHEKALSIRLAIFPKEHPDISSSYINIGGVFLKRKNYNQAQVYYQKALDIHLATFGEQHPEAGNLYNALGSCYFYNGDIDRAHLYFYRSLLIHKSLYPEKHPGVAESYNNLGNCHTYKKEYTQALHYYFLSLAIKKIILGEEHLSTARSYVNIGYVYYKQGEYKLSLAYCQQGLTSILATLGDEHHETAICYKNMSQCYLKIKDYEQAINYCQKTLPIWQKTFGEKNPNTANTYYLFAQIYQAQAQYDQALAYYQKTLSSLALNVSETDYYSLPDLVEYNHAYCLFDTLLSKAAIFNTMYSRHRNVQDLAVVLAHYQCADALINQIRQSYKAENSKLILAEKARIEIYDAANVAIFEYILLQKNTNNPTILSQFNSKFGYQIPDCATDLAFFFAEKGKAVLLYAGIKDAEARINAQLPADMVQQEREWRAELTHLEQIIRDEEYKKENKQNHSALNEWKDRYFKCVFKYDALIERLEKDYPEYYRLKYDLSTATINQIQTLLPSKTALISYTLSGRYLYIITLTADKHNYQQIELPADFDGLVEDFLFSFRQIGKSDYLIYGYDLYRYLLLSTENTGLLKGIERLLIIPDGMLSRLPFEALPTEPCPDSIHYSKLPYLIHRYRISYHYSATLWVNQQKVKDKKRPQFTHSFIGFAPVYSSTIQSNGEENELNLQMDNEFYKQTGIEKIPEPDRIKYEIDIRQTESIIRKSIGSRSFAALLHSESEICQAEHLFHRNGQTTKSLLHEAATLNNFKALAGQYRYILIAAHADYNGEKPEQTGIIFSPDKNNDNNGILYMSDVYNLQLQADLVVLSCCETGLGKINKGEGTMALNRGFLYSGAKNVIYTLFKIYDRESCELTTTLFKELIALQTPIEALHQAKLNLIRRGLMPNKWAGYVLAGE